MTSKGEMWFGGFRIFTKLFFVHYSVLLSPVTLIMQGDWERNVLEERILNHTGPCFQLTWTAALSLPSLSPSIFRASALAEGRRKRRGQWRQRQGQEKVEELGDKGTAYTHLHFDDGQSLLSTVSSFMSSSSAEG